MPKAQRPCIHSPGYKRGKGKRQLTVWGQLEPGLQPGHAPAVLSPFLQYMGGPVMSEHWCLGDNSQDWKVRWETCHPSMSGVHGISTHTVRSDRCLGWLSSQVDRKELLVILPSGGIVSEICVPVDIKMWVRKTATLFLIHCWRRGKELMQLCCFLVFTSVLTVFCDVMRNELCCRSLCLVSSGICSVFYCCSWIFHWPIFIFAFALLLGM